MTVREYMTLKLASFGEIQEAQFLDMLAASGLESLDVEYTAQTAKAAGLGMIAFIAETMLAPRVSEEGDTGSRIVYDYGGLGQYYLWLCRRWGVTPDSEVVDAIGLTTVTDRTDLW